MSIDSQLIVSSIVGNSSTIDGALPKILIYPSILQASGGSELRKEPFNTDVTAAGNFSGRPLLYVYGLPTTTTDPNLNYTSAGDFASTFAGDVVIKGTLWANVLRKNDGSLVNFDSITYTAPDKPIFQAPNATPVSSGEADGILADAIAQNVSDIATNVSDIALKASIVDLNALTVRVSTNETSISSLATELDATQAGSGLDADGAYIANGSSNYIRLATSLADADDKLDAAIFVNEGLIGSNTANIATNATNIANEIINRTAADTTLQTNIDNEAALRISADSDLQSELSATQSGAGLSGDGSYIEVLNSNYLTGSTSLRDADIKLDTRIKANEDAINSISGGTAVLQLENLRVSIGTDNEGVLAAFADTNYLNDIDVVSTALTTLDTAIFNKASSIFDLTGVEHDGRANGQILQYVAADNTDPNNLIPEKFVYVDPQAGPAGADAPTISGMTISGTDIVTSFDGADDITTPNAISLSLDDLSNVDITTITPVINQVLKWDGANFVPQNDISGAAGGTDLNVTDNTTSVATTAILDVQQLATVTSNGNEATLVGIIGNAEDSYDDGLFTDFTATTAIGTAIDRFNEVLKALAPSPAHSLNHFDVDLPQGVTGLTAKLSFGESNDQSQNNPAYISVDNSAGFASKNVNNIYGPEAESDGNYRLGIFTGNQIISGTLNEDKNSDVYTNGIVNYPENSFGSADQGSLKLYLNDIEIASIDDLSQFESGNNLNANNSGFSGISEATPGKFASETLFDNFKHRTGSWQVGVLDQVNGRNYAQVKHIIGDSETVTGFAEWVNDKNTDQIEIANQSLSLNMSGSKYLSGIRYHTSGEATYSADISNFYKYVYNTTDINFVDSSASLDNLINLDSIAIQGIDTAIEDHEKIINIINSSDLLLNNNRILNDDLTVGFTLTHPIKNDIQSANTSETVAGILVDDFAADGTLTSDNFNDEVFRVTVSDSYTQALLDNIASPYLWSSSESLDGDDTGHNTGLMIYNSKLYSPKSNALPNSGNFSTLASSYAGNPDYSGILDNQDRVWIRKFLNTSGSPTSALLFSMSGSGSQIQDEDTLAAGQINVEFKIPSKEGQDERDWMSVASNFNLEDHLSIPNTNTSCGDSTHNGDTVNSPMTLGTINNKLATFGQDLIDDGDYILAKITAKSSWTGNVDSFSVDFNSVIGATANIPEVDHIDATQTGIVARLSFGNTNTIGTPGTPLHYNNYTSDINTLFDTNGDKLGVFDGNQDISGLINDLTPSIGNSYPQYAFGGGEGNVGILRLNVNGVPVHTVDLSTIPYVSGNQLNGNNSGFTNLSNPLPSRDANNRPDYLKFFRTAGFVVSTSDQRLGYNYATITHLTSDNLEETNTIEWINDDSPNAPDFTNNGSATYNIDSSLVSSTETNSLSGVEYYRRVTNVPYEITVKNLYNNVYSSLDDAITVSDSANNSKIKSILLTGVNNNTITTAGSDDVLPGNQNSGSSSLPAINSFGDQEEAIKVESIFEMNYTKSIPDLSDPVNPYDSMNFLTVNTTAKHPLNAPNGEPTSGNNEIASSLKFLQYEVSAVEQSVIAEDFSNETKRLPGNIAYDDQSDASNASWVSSDVLTDGLMFYDSKLIYPNGDFRDVTDQGDNPPSIHAPDNNPNYIGTTGIKYFYRIFQNNTQSSKTGFVLTIEGNGATLVGPNDNFSATNIKVSVKIPLTGEEGDDDRQSTGYLNIAKPFETDSYEDGDGSLSGVLDANISAGNSAVNTTTFGQKFLTANEYFVMKIEANESWTGYLSNITVNWS